MPEGTPSGVTRGSGCSGRALRLKLGGLLESDERISGFLVRAEAGESCRLGGLGHFESLVDARAWLRWSAAALVSPLRARSCPMPAQVIECVRLADPVPEIAEEGECLGEHLGRSRVVAGLVLHCADVLKSIGLAELDPGIAEEGQCRSRLRGTHYISLTASARPPCHARAGAQSATPKLVRPLNVSRPAQLFEYVN
jgi:hypothetical protein